MGQNHSEKVKQAVQALKQSGEIPTWQLEAFETDLEASLPIIEVEKFIENPTLETFLLEVVLRLYPPTHSLPSPFNPAKSRNFNQSTEPTDSQILSDQISSALHTIQSYWQAVSAKAYDLCIDKKSKTLPQGNLWKLVCEALNAEWMEVSERAVKVREQNTESGSPFQSREQFQVGAMESPSCSELNGRIEKSQFNLEPLIITRKKNRAVSNYYGWGIQCLLRNKKIKANIFASELSFASFLRNQPASTNSVLSSQFAKCYASITNTNTHTQTKYLLMAVFSLMSSFMGLFEQYYSTLFSSIASSLDSQLSAEAVLSDGLERLRAATGKKQFLLKCYYEDFAGQAQNIIIFNKDGNIQFFSLPSISSELSLAIKTSFSSKSQQAQILQIFDQSQELRSKVVLSSKGLLGKNEVLSIDEADFYFKTDPKGKILYILVAVRGSYTDESSNNNTTQAPSIEISPLKSRTISNLTSPKGFNFDLEQLSNSLLNELKKTDKAPCFCFEQEYKHEQMVKFVLEACGGNDIFEDQIVRNIGRFENFLTLVLLKMAENRNVHFTPNHALKALLWANQVASGFQQLDSIDKLGLMLASFCQHLTSDCSLNEIEVLNQSHAAELYNHQMPLQNSCAKSIFSIMRQNQACFVSYLEAAEFRRIRNSLIENIYSTDDQCKEPVYITKPKEAEGVERAKLRFLIMKCARYSFLLEDHSRGIKWLNTYLAELREQMESTTIKLNSTSKEFEKLKTTSRFISKVVLPPFQELQELVSKREEGSSGTLKAVEQAVEKIGEIGAAKEGKKIKAYGHSMGHFR